MHCWVTPRPQAAGHTGTVNANCSKKFSRAALLLPPVLVHLTSHYYYASNYPHHIGQPPGQFIE